MSTGCRPASHTAYPKVEAVNSAASLIGATNNGGGDAAESANIDVGSCFGIADMFIDADSSGESVDLYVVTAWSYRNGNGVKE